MIADCVVVEIVHRAGARSGGQDPVEMGAERVPLSVL